MQTIDEISIGREGDMFTLTIYVYGGTEEGEDYTLTRRPTTTFLIGLPDQFHEETQRTIGQWLTRAVGQTGAVLTPASEPWPYQPDALTHDAQGDDDQ